MSKRGVIRLVIVGVAVGLAAGCGGGANAPTKDEFVKQVSEICSKANQKLGAAGQEFFKKGSGPPPTEGQFVNQKVVPIFEQELIDPVDALTPPKGDQDEIDAILNAGRDALQRLKANPESLQAPSGSAKDPFLTFGKLAKSYGLKCGGGS